MEDSPRQKWWLIATAAIVALLTLFYYTGSWLMVAIFLAVIGAFVAIERLRAAKPASNLCLRCGAPLNPNARQCRDCGSASWTARVN